jgi:RNA polymerase sigma factor (sigma-70 family)
MADPRNDPLERRHAWGVFYGRHAEYIRRVCVRAHFHLIGYDGAKDAVHDTFLRAYEKAGTFKLTEIPGEAQQKAVRAWQVRINENIVRDYFRNRPKVVFVESPEEESVESQPLGSVPDPEELSSARIALVERALAELNEREERVLRETMFWYVPGLRVQRMPHSAMEALAAELGTTAANIRQMRARAMVKVRKYIEDRL